MQRRLPVRFSIRNNHCHNNKSNNLNMEAIVHTRKKETSAGRISLPMEQQEDKEAQQPILRVIRTKGRSWSSRIHRLARCEGRALPFQQMQMENFRLFQVLSQFPTVGASRQDRLPSWRERVAQSIFKIRFKLGDEDLFHE